MTKRTDFWRVLSEHAARAPDLEALLAPGRSPLTSAELVERVDAVRAALARFGIGRGDLVALALPDGPETALCLLGVTCGAIAVPLNPAYSDDEFARYLARIRPRAIIAPAGRDDAARRQAAAREIQVIDLDVRRGAAGTFDLRCDHGGTPDRPGWNGEDDVALLLLTSGSTGEPKLVPHRQRHVAAYAQFFAQAYDLGPADRCIHTMPMFHGHGVESLLLAPLLLGSGVVCPERFDVPSFFAHLRTHRPTWYSAAYTIHQAILDGIEPYRTVAREAGLRFIRSGSGRLDPELMAGLEEAFGAPVVERYGMSEAPTLTYNPLPPAVRKPGTVGIPMLSEVRIRDEPGFVSEPGREGEVVARGPLVFDGYWDDPEATAAAFVDGWFRTGDLGRFDEDGYLTITGRLKDVINRGGEKVSPAEVEQVLCEHPEAKEACVFAVPHPSLGEEILAAVVPAAGTTRVEEADLLEYLRARVASFKVPRRIVLCASLAKADSGKVSRVRVAQACLAVLARTSAAETRSAPAPSVVEREILGIWNAVLGSDTTDLHQDFFLAGGDSLRAAELFSRIEHQCGVTLTLGEIFDDATTVAGIARLVEQTRPQRKTAATGLVPIQPDGARPPLFGVPGGGGNPLGFVHLARALDPQQPFYGIESRGLDGSTPPFDDMEDIVADHLSAVRSLQPDGPYHLCGLCFGARVAYEMAYQLEAAGERVGLLILLDPSPPFTDGAGKPRGRRDSSRRRVWPAIARMFRDHIGYHARTVTRLRGANRRDYLRDKLDRLYDILRRGGWSQLYRAEIRRRSVREANYHAGMHHIPHPYGGTTLVRFARDRPIHGDRDYRLDWLDLLSGCEEPAYISGHDSGSIVAPENAAALASRIEESLLRARETNPAAVGRAATPLRPEPALRERPPPRAR